MVQQKHFSSEVLCFILSCKKKNLEYGYLLILNLKMSGIILGTTLLSLKFVDGLKKKIIRTVYKQVCKRCSLNKVNGHSLG